MNFRLPGMQMRMIDKEDELALFLEMRKIENQRDSVFLHNSDEFDASLGMILLFLIFLFGKVWIFIGF